ncbi:hypothetical protein EV379_2356 [Microterricola gilva]|uniref:GRAM domain-containing protein n=1 Tax=Microterricola gilva TaxID=393267 RepID=A0A4Q8APC1_9MICO|nr:hypothetical protein [Microterricola gilva]RZU66011.1 hypothetical protein EV379_2356 [Microterricola gilva]
MVPGETPLLSRNASFLVNPIDYGRKPALRDALLGGRIAIGGTLMLTNYRLAFSASPLVSTIGEFGFSLPRVLEVTDTSRGVLRTIRVRHEAGDWSFIVHGIPTLLSAIHSAKAAFDLTDLARIEGTEPSPSS